LRFCFHRLVQQPDLLIEHGHQLQQVISAPPRPRFQRKLAQHLLTRLALQFALPLHPLIQASVLQFVLSVTGH
jgi:hypothetical protein